MKKQSEAEEIVQIAKRLHAASEAFVWENAKARDVWGEIGRLDQDRWCHITTRLLTALKRRGWTPPKTKGRNK